MLKPMLLRLVAVAMAVCLAGCDNSIDAQVEKCVQSLIKAIKLNRPDISEADLAQAEASARLKCLRSAAGKE